MGFRFQKRIKFGKFFTVNLSKSGVSGSVGVEGAQVTVGHGKVTKTVGLPDTGLSYSTRERIGKKEGATIEKDNKPLTPRDIFAIVRDLIIISALSFVMISWLL
jgi:hypothetical protein